MLYWKKKWEGIGWLYETISLPKQTCVFLLLYFACTSFKTRMLQNLFWKIIFISCIRPLLLHMKPIALHHIDPDLIRFWLSREGMRFGYGWIKCLWVYGLHPVRRDVHRSLWRRKESSWFPVFVVELFTRF